MEYGVLVAGRFFSTMTAMRSMVRRGRIRALALALGIAGCSDSTGSADGDQFRFRESLTDEIIRIQISNASGLAEANQLLLSGEARWVLGTPRRGDGGFNTGYSWHLDPASISFAEVTIEACQSAANAVADDLDYWIGFGRVCIWGVVQARES
jgi:hypothetical protein